MILKHFGGNDFTPPHSGVRKNQSAGSELSLSMKIPTKVMADVKKSVAK
jgi:hypothetical protein